MCVLVQLGGVAPEPAYTEIQGFAPSTSRTGTLQHAAVTGLYDFADDGFGGPQGGYTEMSGGKDQAAAGHVRRQAAAARVAGQPGYMDMTGVPAAGASQQGGGGLYDFANDGFGGPQGGYTEMRGEKDRAAADHVRRQAAAARVADQPGYMDMTGVPAAGASQQGGGYLQVDGANEELLEI